MSAFTPAQIAWDYDGGKPVAHWKFDEASSGSADGDVIHDSSGRGLNGTGVDGANNLGLSWVAGKRGNAVDFDGVDDYVDVGDTNLNINAISFWMKANSTDASLIDLDNGTHTVTMSGGAISANGFVSPAIYIDANRTNTVPDNAWHHVLISSNTAIDANNFDIGRIGAGYFAGQIDDVRLYNYVPVAAQIREDFAGGTLNFGNNGIESGSALTPSWTCGTSELTDIDGNSYATVQLGTQCWMAENLMVSKNADGSAVNGTGDADTTPPEAYGDVNWQAVEGYLYNWQDVMNGSTVQGAQGICPTGWHVPTHDEWTDLERYICNAEGNASCNTAFPKDITTIDYRGTNEGTELKADAPVNGIGTDPNGDDGYGFASRLTGFHFTNSSFFNRGTYGFFWSSSESGVYAWSRYLYSAEQRIGRSAPDKGYGLSVRCLKD
jgi:uncharacterized protein (TIGR02145 family)